MASLFYILCNIMEKIVEGINLLRSLGVFSLVEILFLLGILGWMGAAWKWADWSRFVEFRATIYIFILGDFLYNLLVKDDKLWIFVSPNLHVSHEILTVVTSFFTAPFAIMLFLSNYPAKSLLKQFGFILLFIGIYSIHEWIALRAGIFDHDNGWNLWWSLLINALAFPFLRLHQLKPVLAIFVFLLCTVGFSVLFDIDILKHDK